MPNHNTRSLRRFCASLCADLRSGGESYGPRSRLIDMVVASAKDPRNVDNVCELDSVKRSLLSVYAFANGHQDLGDCSSSSESESCTESTEPSRASSSLGVGLRLQSPAPCSSVNTMGSGVVTQGGSGDDQTPKPVMERDVPMAPETSRRESGKVCTRDLVTGRSTVPSGCAPDNSSVNGFSVNAERDQTLTEKNQFQSFPVAAAATRHPQMLNSSLPAVSAPLPDLAPSRSAHKQRFLAARSCSQPEDDSKGDLNLSSAKDVYPCSNNTGDTDHKSHLHSSPPHSEGSDIGVVAIPAAKDFTYYLQPQETPQSAPKAKPISRDYQLSFLGHFQSLAEQLTEELRESNKFRIYRSTQLGCFHQMVESFVCCKVSCALLKLGSKNGVSHGGGMHALGLQKALDSIRRNVLKELLQNAYPSKCQRMGNRVITSRVERIVWRELPQSAISQGTQLDNYLVEEILYAKDRVLNYALDTRMDAGTTMSTTTRCILAQNLLHNITDLLNNDPSVVQTGAPKEREKLKKLICVLQKTLHGVQRPRATRQWKRALFYLTMTIFFPLMFVYIVLMTVKSWRKHSLAQSLLSNERDGSPAVEESRKRLKHSMLSREVEHLLRECEKKITAFSQKQGISSLSKATMPMMINMVKALLTETTVRPVNQEPLGMMTFFCRNAGNADPIRGEIPTLELCIEELNKLLEQNVKTQIVNTFRRNSIAGDVNQHPQEPDVSSVTALCRRCMQLARQRLVFYGDHYPCADQEGMQADDDCDPTFAAVGKATTQQDLSLSGIYARVNQLCDLVLTKLLDQLGSACYKMGPLSPGFASLDLVPPQLVKKELEQISSGIILAYSLAPEKLNSLLRTEESQYLGCGFYNNDIQSRGPVVKEENPNSVAVSDRKDDTGSEQPKADDSMDNHRRGANPEGIVLAPDGAQSHCKQPFDPLIPAATFPEPRSQVITSRQSWQSLGLLHRDSATGGSSYDSFSLLDTTEDIGETTAAAVNCASKEHQDEAAWCRGETIGDDEWIKQMEAWRNTKPSIATTNDDKGERSRCSTQQRSDGDKVSTTLQAFEHPEYTNKGNLVCKEGYTLVATTAHKSPKIQLQQSGRKIHEGAVSQERELSGEPQNEAEGCGPRQCLTSPTTALQRCEILCTARPLQGEARSCD